MSKNSDEFYRINEPRADKILDMVRIIDKSARSLKCEEDATNLKRRIAAKIGLVNTFDKASAPPPVAQNRPTDSRQFGDWVRDMDRSAFSALVAAIAARFADEMSIRRRAAVDLDERGARS